MERDYNNSYGSNINHFYFTVGVFVSLFAHVTIVVIGCIRMNDAMENFKMNEPFVVYSVSAEGGKTLGGISQVSKTGKKEPLVPYKKVEEKQEAPAPKAVEEATQKDEETVKVEEEKAKAKAEAEKKAKEEAEISIKKEEERKAKEKAEKEAKAKAEAEKKAKAEAEAKAKAEAEKKAKAEAEKKKKEEELKKAKEAKEGAKKQNPANAKKNGVVGGTGKGDSSAKLDTQLQQALQRYIGESSDAGGVGFGAGKITGGNGMGGGIVRPPEFFKYKDILVKHIKANWNWFDTSQPYKAQVELFIDKSGNITKYQIVTSSGLDRFDDSILRAIQKASPVPAPPANVYEFFEDVRIVFDPRE